MNRRQAEMMLKHAAFLRTVPPKAFDFDVVCDIGDGTPQEALKSEEGCGTVACAMGWTPLVFPRRVEWTKLPRRGDSLSVQMKSRNAYGYGEVAQTLYGITSEEADYLFTPGGHWDRPNLLPAGVEPKEVAAHMERFARKRLRELSNEARRRGVAA